MSQRAKILTLVAAVAVAVGAFIALKPGDDPKPGPPAARPEGAGPSRPAPDRPVASTPAQRVVRGTVTVDSNGPVGGVAEIRANAGERIVITVKSTGYSGEAHLHGFDVMRDVAPGKPAIFEVSAAQTSKPSGQGSFELELEAIAVQIAKLLISP
ncbi:MAG: hypothetical protein WCO96_09015 [Actinomycetes bacterium]